MKFSRRSLLLSASALGFSSCADARFPRGGAARVQSWSTMPIGGGGYLDGIDIAPDGTVVVRSDTHPAPYLLSGSTWLPLQTANSMPAAYAVVRTATDNNAIGAWEIRICPSLPTKFYMIGGASPNGKLLVTTNSGALWTELTNFPAQADLAENDNFRGFNYRMAVDPQNDAILFVGTVSGGLQRTLNSGGAWTTRTVGTGTGTSGVGMAIAFDPTSSVSSSAKQGLFVCRYGDGVYHSTDGGGSFTKLNTTNMPTTFRDMMVDQNGKLWIADNSGSFTNLWTWTSGAGWVSIPVDTSLQGIHSFDVDPTNALRVATAGGGGAISTSTDGGANWNSVWNNTTVNGGSDSPWMQTSYPNSYSNYFITDGKIRFDTQTAGKLWQAWGFGLMYAANAFASTSAITFTASVRGIEGLDAVCIIHPPGGNPIGGGYDVPIWNFLSYTSAPSEYKPVGYNNGISPVDVPTSKGWALDFAKSDPTFIVAVTGLTHTSLANGYRGFYSTNKGVDWLPFADQNAAFWTNAYGSIAASTPSNIVVQTGDATFYTLNGGALWAASTYAGNIGAYPFSAGQQFIAADANVANKFLIISASGDGIYSSTNGGATFAKISTFSAASAGFDQKILSIPGHTDHYLLTGGYLDTADHPISGGRLYRSTDGGQNWGTGIPNIGECWCMDYGTTVSGQSYPTIYFAGWADRGSGLEFGVWKTIDNFTTFVLLGNTHNPMGWYSLISGIAGDKNIDGACSISYFGGGFKTFR